MLVRHRHWACRLHRQGGSLPVNAQPDTITRMRLSHGKRMDRPKTPELNAWVAAARIRHPLREPLGSSQFHAPRSDNALGRPSRIMGLTRFLGAVCVLAVLGASVQTVQSVTLEWDPSPDTNIAGYKLYYGAVSRGYTNAINVGNVTRARVSGLVEGVTYYFDSIISPPPRMARSGWAASTRMKSVTRFPWRTTPRPLR